MRLLTKSCEHVGFVLSADHRLPSDDDKLSENILSDRLEATDTTACLEKNRTSGEKEHENVEGSLSLR